MAVDNLWSKAFGGAGRGLFSFLGIGGGASGAGSAASSAVGNPLQLSGFYADGTDNHHGGWSVVGEKGPELVNLPKESQVLPNGVMPSGGGDPPHFADSFQAKLFQLRQQFR